ncbi:MAG: Allophanate hydrolase 2 subunit 2 (EC [uncultured Paraburkholderia sp.]|nr:MAG: Allophanate hydrolase 2 subunit 2 (EC [uncultured Paraburkholderia sp.]CAH2922692.1 MAG: Allophanate hydrolase 2 subunit 2 (EC [uncultured Paraburkholderia sp.]
MRDAQTTGGYPKIGAIIQADLWKLAQVRLNTAIRFIPTIPYEARQALLGGENARICGRSTPRSRCTKNAANARRRSQHCNNNGRAASPGE